MRMTGSPESTTPRWAVHRVFSVIYQGSSAHRPPSETKKTWWLGVGNMGKVVETSVGMPVNRSDCLLILFFRDFQFFLPIKYR